MKKSVAILLISSLLISLFIGVTSAVDVPTSAGGGNNTDIVPQSILTFISNWEKGSTLDAITIKWLFLILIAILVFSILGWVGFPENGFLRAGLGVIVSFLATYYLTPDELWGLMTSYSALGITLALFLPIAILIFFTVITSVKGSPVGVFFAKIMWLIYGVYVIWRGLMVLILKAGIENWGEINVTIDNAGVASVNWGTAKVAGYAESVLQLISERTMGQALETSTSIAFLLIIIGIAVLWIGVIKSRWLDSWLKSGIREAEVESFKDKMKKGVSFYKTGAEEVEGASKKP